MRTLTGFFSLLILLFTLSLNSQEIKKTKLSAKELLEMKTEDAVVKISKLNKADSAALITQVRVEAKTNYANIDNFYFLISHLERITAIEEEQERLRSLHLVYGLSLAILMVFLGIILYQQRKAVNHINQLLKE